MSLLRDQLRARSAYAHVGSVAPTLRSDYAIAVRALGTNLRRLGLAAAVSLLERRKQPASQLLLKHITEGLPELRGNPAARAREVDDLGSYMHLTRELLRRVSWFHRAVQALYEVEPDTPSGAPPCAAP